MKIEIKNINDITKIITTEIVDLRYGRLSGANLRSADLRFVNLRHANLQGADLSYADLSGANLYGADLSSVSLYGTNLIGTNLIGANLRSADLRSANLRSFKADLWLALSQNPNEVGAVISALREGKIDGSQYEKKETCLIDIYSDGCAHFLSTITLGDCKGGSEELVNPAEIWLSMIRGGDMPESEACSGSAARKALEWCLEWQALNQIEKD